VKVLHVEGGSNLYGGARQVLYLLEGLQRRQVRNVLACRPNSAIAQLAGQFADVRPIRMGGDLDLALVRRLYRLIRSERPDLVHLHSRIGADVMGGIACRLAGVPVVHSRRQDNPERRWVVALKYRLHDRVIAISEGIAGVLLAEGLAPAKLRCVRSAVAPAPDQRPCDRSWLAREFAVPAQGRVIGVVAQLIPRKGHRVLLDALPSLLPSFPDLYVIFFGKGPEEAALRTTIERLGLTERVRLAGFRTDLPSVLPCLSLLVHPALMEGLGVSLLQAASAGVPIVASRAGGIPEAVRDGVNGLLVPPGDASALAEAIGRLLGDPGLARAMGEAGRRLMQEEFSVDAMVEGNLRVYRDVLAERAGGRADRD
jgi:glycosyltransferase involved in cell wall biosynthesis